MLSDLTLDGNPLANAPDHRQSTIFHIRHLWTLDQRQITVCVLMWYELSGQYLGHVTQYWGHMTKYLGHMTQYWGHMTKYLGHMTQYWGHMTQYLDHMTQYWGHMTQY